MDGCVLTGKHGQLSKMSEKTKEKLRRNIKFCFLPSVSIDPRSAGMRRSTGLRSAVESAVGQPHVHMAISINLVFSLKLWVVASLPLNRVLQRHVRFSITDHGVEEGAQIGESRWTGRVDDAVAKKSSPPLGKPRALSLHGVHQR